MQSEIVFKGLVYDIVLWIIHWMQAYESSFIFKKWIHLVFRV